MKKYNADEMITLKGRKFYYNSLQKNLTIYDKDGNFIAKRYLGGNTWETHSVYVLDLFYSVKPDSEPMTASQEEKFADIFHKASDWKSIAIEKRKEEERLKKEEESE